MPSPVSAFLSRATYSRRDAEDETCLVDRKVSQSLGTRFKSLSFGHGSSSANGLTSLVRAARDLQQRTDQFVGDVFHLNAAGQPILVLNTVKATQDLFGKREFAERPHLVRRTSDIFHFHYLTFLGHGWRSVWFW